ncbi:MAG TPA: hypothetical protein VFW31_10390 [Candidatus Angelobacter sp.]|nr:hypothetical protein [Candidatus Angelobacter sp.]
MLIVLGPLAPLVIAFVWYFDGRIQPNRSFFDFVGLPIIVVWSTYSSVRRARKEWETLEVEFRMGKLIRKRPGYPDLEFAPGDITRIVESHKGMVIETGSHFRRLFISKHLVDYGDFRADLRAWAPSVSIVPAERSIRAWVLSVASVLGGMCLFGLGPIYLMGTSHRELVVPLGIALCLANFAFILVFMLRSPEMPSRFRYTGWILPALPLLAMFIRLS